MGLYVIGDTHLSLNDENKKMDIFNGWSNYVTRLKENWQANITSSDTVVLAGDISWGMNLEDTYKDFYFLNSLPGRKIILKGNHDYWFSSKTKVDNYLKMNSFDTINILYNNHYEYDNINIVGTRGWMIVDERDKNNDYEKILKREIGRLLLSLSKINKDNHTIAFFHYPPIYNGIIVNEFIEIFKQYNIKECFYGHIHDKYCQFSFNGDYEGISFKLISSDFLNFMPLLIKN